MDVIVNDLRNIILSVISSKITNVKKLLQKVSKFDFIYLVHLNIVKNLPEIPHYISVGI